MGVRTPTAVGIVAGASAQELADLHDEIERMKSEQPGNKTLLEQLRRKERHLQFELDQQLGRR